MPEHNPHPHHHHSAHQHPHHSEGPHHAGHKRSHFSDTIPNDGHPHGHSRHPGDATLEVKAIVVGHIIEECVRQGLSMRDTAQVIAIARLESGFNPDAAAPESSAAGVGQIINKTGEHYSLGEHNRFDIHDNVHALVSYYRDSKELAHAHGQSDAFIYKYYHDGPSVEHGGLALSHHEVMPFVKEYTTMLEQPASSFAESTKMLASATRAGSHVSYAEHSPTGNDGTHELRHQPHAAHFELAADHGTGIQHREPQHIASAEAVHVAQGTSHTHGVTRVEGHPHNLRPDEPLRVANSTHSEHPGFDVASARLSLEQALAKHLEEKGFDHASVAQASDLAHALQEGVGARALGHDVVVIHKQGEALATVASAQEALDITRPGDSVLSLKAVDHVATHGLDSAAVAALRENTSHHGAGSSDLELAHVAQANEMPAATAGPLLNPAQAVAFVDTPPTQPVPPPPEHVYEMA